MQKSIKDLLGHIGELLFVRLERVTTFDDHKKLIDQWCYEIDRMTQIESDSGSIIEFTGHQAIVNIITAVQNFLPYQSRRNFKPVIRHQIDMRSIRFDDFFNVRERFETATEFQLMEFLILAGGESVGNVYNDNLSLMLNRHCQLASWSGSYEEIDLARRISSMSFLGLKCAILKPEQVITHIKKFISALPPNAWFSSQGMLYGSSFLLRSLLMLCRMDYQDVLRDYIEEVCERLLRRVEIKQRRAFQFCNETSPSDSSYFLERLRFSLGILEAAEVFNDVRYLNAALKMNDWHYKVIRNKKIPRTIKPHNYPEVLTILHYLANIVFQERYLLKLCPH